MTTAIGNSYDRRNVILKIGIIVCFYKHKLRISPSKSSKEIQSPNYQPKNKITEMCSAFYKMYILGTIPGLPPWIGVIVVLVLVVFIIDDFADLLLAILFVKTAVFADTPKTGD